MAPCPPTPVPSIAGGSRTERRKGEGNTKCGNKYLAWAFVEAANFAVRYDAQIKHWYQKEIGQNDARHWRSRLWRTSWRAPAITFSRREKRSM